MTTYLPALIWTLSSFVCIYIARRRRVKPTVMETMVAALIGPLAIVWVLLAAPEKTQKV